MSTTLAMRRELPQLFKHCRPASIGFESLFDTLMEVADAGIEPAKYPPYNIWKIDDANYQIEIALAGLDRHDIDLELTNGLLTVQKDTPAIKQEFEPLYQGISRRNFSLSFKIAPDVHIREAKMKNGILSVYLEQIIPEERKPKKIAISD